MADLNGDGMDDVTGLAVGVVQDRTSPTGYSFQGIPTYFNGAPYGSGTGGYVATGTQIPLDAESIRASQARTATEAAAQRAQAAYWQGSLANQAAGTAASSAASAASTAQAAAASAQRHEEAMAQYAQQGAIAERQFQIDMQKFGLDVATFNWQKNKAAADMALQHSLFGVQQANFQLSQNQFNASQQQAKESARQNILKMLADRTGPQDAYAYNNLLNGLNAPNPTKSTTLDPMAGLADLYKESTVATPQWQQPALDTAPFAPTAPSAVNLPSYPGGGAGAGATSGTSGTSGGGGTTSSAPAQPPLQVQKPIDTVATGTAPGQTPTQTPTSSYSGVPNEQVANIQPGQFAFVTTGSAGPSNLTDYNGWQVFQNPTTQWSSPVIPGGTPIWLKKLAQGGDVGYGETSAPPPKRDPNRIAVAAHTRMRPGMKTMAKGGDVLDKKGRVIRPASDTVQPGEAAAVVGDKPGNSKTQEIAVARQGPNGQPMLHVIPHDRAMQILQQIRMRHAATGGTYGTSLSDPTITVNQYSPQDIGNMPAYQKLIGNMPNRPFGAFGATVSNPALGLNNVPTQFSMQRWNQLLPSEQKLIGSMYGQGLGMDINDMQAAAAAAAPEGRHRSYATGMMPAAYGR